MIEKVTLPLTAPSFDESDIEMLRACLDSKWVTQGPMTERFEKLVGDRQGVKHALACTSCTAALHLAALALNLGPGDEVVVPASLGSPARMRPSTSARKRSSLTSISRPTISIPRRWKRP